MQTHMQHLQAFRGISIICIVAAHAWSFSIFWTGQLDSTGLKAVFYSTELLFHGSTIFFAIISGLLFSLLMVALACIPIVISRSTFPDFLTVQSTVYFGGAYCLGMIIGKNYDKTMALVAQYQAWLLALIVIASAAILTQYINEYEVEGWYSSRQTFFYIQKVLICLVLLKWLKTIESKLPKFISDVGQYSFSIYFYHVLFVGILIISAQTFVQSNRTALIISMLGIGNMLMGVCFTMAIAWVFKKILKRHSRKIIGV